MDVTEIVRAEDAANAAAEIVRGAHGVLMAFSQPNCPSEVNSDVVAILCEALWSANESIEDAARTLRGLSQANAPEGTGAKQGHAPHDALNMAAETMAEDGIE
jgi:hypothetical protein